MDAGEVLKRAWEAVQAAGLPESLQLKGFELAVEMLSASNGGGTTVKLREEEEGGGADASPRRKAKTNGGPPIEKIAHESGIDADALEGVIHFDADGAPHVTGPARRLGRNTSEQARTVALLVTAARSLAMDEVNVSAKVVREECTRLKCFDQSNFGKHTGTTPGVTTIGDGQSRTFKLKSGDAGFTPLKQAVDRVRGVTTES